VETANKKSPTICTDTREDRRPHNDDARRHPRWTTPFETALLQKPATHKNPWITGKT
jgi:hypothetical protein